MRQRGPYRGVRGWLHQRLATLSVRLFLLLFATLIVAVGVYAFVSIRTTSENCRQTVLEAAQRFVEMIQYATHHSMLLNRKEDVHHTIRAIARSSGVDDVRIYDKQGAIIFSAEDQEIGKRVDLHAEACVSCHATEGPLESLPSGDTMRVFRRSNGERVLGLIQPIPNAPECSSADCHAHPPEKSILGVLDVTMSLAAPDARLATVEHQALIAALLIALLAGVMSAVFIVRVVRRPVRALTAGVQRVASGCLDTELAVGDGSEIGALAKAFNAMTRDLKDARGELTNWSARLEQELERKTDELSRTQRQIAHMDKMASLGKLATTVAHELNNPLAGILNYAKLVERSLRESDTSIPEADEIGRYLGLIQREAGRSGDIVRNLILFARPAGARLAPHHLNGVLDRAAMLVRHHTEIANIQFELQQLEGDDELVCDADQVQQALVALLVNAVEAMQEGGHLRLAAANAGDAVHVEVTDTGTGIPPDALPHIFEPFFTSKEDRNGAGLGLAVVYGIIQKHGGEIEVHSEVGRGTTFRLVLPRQPPAQSDSPAGAVDDTTSKKEAGH